MSDTNIVVLKGRLTKSAELKYTQGQRPYVTFSIAVNDSIKNQTTGEWESRPNFFDVTVWGKYGESVAKYMGRGREVLVTGRLRQDRWQDQNGQTKSRITVVSENMELLREPKGGQSASDNPPPPSDAPDFPPPEQDAPPSDAPVF